jgi:hypothetical protein
MAPCVLSTNVWHPMYPIMCGGLCIRPCNSRHNSVHTTPVSSCFFVVTFGSGLLSVALLSVAFDDGFVAVDNGFECCF